MIGIAIVLIVLIVIIVVLIIHANNKVLTVQISTHRTDKYSQHSSIIWPAWLNG